MRENQSSPANREEPKDLRPAGPTDPSGDRSATTPESECRVFEQVAGDMRLFPLGAKAEGLEQIRIGGYQIERTLGAGGMGIVLLGSEPSSKQQVAIKLIRPEYLLDPSAVRAFLREAHHMSRMAHPNVVPVREVSGQSDCPYYVMPYFAQGSLSRRIGGEGPLDPDLVPVVARQIAEALGYAHGRGIIHRDVKPSNILIADDGQACLADFGLVRTVFNDTISETRHNWCVGTPAYMSPAVAAGQPEDTRCDIYSFGAVLYAMLTGAAPYGGREAQHVLDQILAGPPTPISRLNPAAHAHLVSIAEGAMARELRDRYACMADIESDLDRVTAGKAPLGPRGRRPETQGPTTAGSVTTEHDAPVATADDRVASKSQSNRFSRIPVVVMGIAVLAIPLAFYAFHRAGPLINSGERPLFVLPVPGPRSHLGINSFECIIYPDLNAGNSRVIGDTSPFAYAWELARVEADLASPAFCCLLELHPNGTVQVWYPPGQEERAAESQPPLAVTRVTVPSSGNKYISLDEDGLGLAAYVLVAWREPSKVSFEGLRSLAQKNWGQIASAKNAAAGTWEYDGALFRQSGQVRGHAVEGPDPPEPFERTCQELRDHPGIEAIRARAFLIKEGGPSGIQRKPDDREPGPSAPGALADADKKRVASLENEQEECFKAGKFSAAIPPAREILKIRGGSQPAGHWEVRTAGEQLRSCERLAATPQVQQDRVRIAWDAFSQGTGEINERRFDKAEPLFRKALEAFREVLGEQDYYTLLIDNELGNALYQLAFYDQAAEVFRRELTGFRTLFDEMHPMTALAHDMLAMSLHVLGDDDGALDHGNRALQTFIRLQGEYSADAATSYNTTGSYLEALGEYDEAEKRYRRGLEIHRKTLGTDHRETARSYNNLAVLLYNRNRFPEAAYLNRTALAIRLKVVDATPQDIARSEDNLATCLDEQGEFAAAEKLHAMAYTRRLDALGDDHPDTILSLNNLAFNLRSQGRYNEAETTWAKAALGFERARLKVASAGLERAAFSAARSPMIALAVLLARHNKPREAWERLESNLGRGLADELAARDARPLQPGERQKEKEFLDNLQALENQITTAQLPGNVARPAVDPLKIKKDNIQADFDGFKRGLVEKYGVTSGQVYELERIQRQLASNVALVGWVDLDLPRKASEWNSEHWAFLVRSQGEPTWVKLSGSGPGGAWNDLDQELPQRVRQMVSNPPVAGAKNWRELAGRLAHQRLGPLHDHLQSRGTLPSVGHVVILPSPALEGVPVEVLLDAWEVHGHPLTASYVPSGTIYAWLRERRAERNKAGRPTGPGKLLAVGNPVFPSSEPVARPSLHSPAEDTTGLVSRLNRQRDKLGPLPGTEKEIKAIAGFFKTPSPKLLLGADANEAELYKLARDDGMRRFDVIHLATHGIIDDRVPMRFALLLTGQRSTRMPEGNNSVADDGYGVITAGQVLRTWKLDADLVTLSACQTALGKTSGGEGQIGFAQALFIAGSQSLILSLWKVDDEATAMLMTDFYGEYTKHVGTDDHGRRKAAALHHARTKLRNSSGEQRIDNSSDRSRGREVKGADATKRGHEPPYDHPYYWAGFVLIGDPQ